MATCKDCVHFDVCCSYLSTAYNKCKLATPDFKLLKNIECDECQHFKDHSRFVELPFEPNKGASSFDKVAHITYTFATEAHPLVRHTVEGYYVMYNEERLYTLEKDGVVILAHGSSPHDTVEKAKHAIEGLSKERESNA